MGQEKIVASGNERNKNPYHKQMLAIKLYFIFAKTCNLRVSTRFRISGSNLAADFTGVLPKIHKKDFPFRVIAS